MTATIHTSVDVEIARPPADVWAVVSDYATDSRWRKGITEMTADVAGPPAVGTCAALHSAGRDYVTDTTVTEVGPQRYRFAGEGPAAPSRAAAGSWPAPIPARPSSPTTSTCSRALSSVARPVMGLVAAPVLAQDLHRLRDLIETGA